MPTTPAMPFVERAGAMVSNLTTLQKVEAFLSLFHKPGERFFFSWRGPGETEITHHEPFDDPIQAAARAAGLAAECDLYFTPAIFKAVSARRLATAVEAPNSLWLDLDKDPYGSLDATLAALGEFADALGMPPSVVVRTGNGFPCVLVRTASGGGVGRPPGPPTRRGRQARPQDQGYRPHDRRGAHPPGYRARRTGRTVPTRSEDVPHCHRQGLRRGPLSGPRCRATSRPNGYGHALRGRPTPTR